VATAWRHHRQSDNHHNQFDVTVTVIISIARQARAAYIILRGARALGVASSKTRHGADKAAKTSSKAASAGIYVYRRGDDHGVAR